MLAVFPLLERARFKTRDNLRPVFATASRFLILPGHDAILASSLFQFQRSPAERLPIIAAVALTVFASRADNAKCVAQPAIEQSPSLRLKARAHRWPRNRIRFLDNPPAACDTPEWRVARSVRSPGRLGGQDRAFNAFSGLSNYSGSVRMTKFPHLSRAIPPGEGI